MARHSSGPALRYSASRSCPPAADLSGPRSGSPSPTSRTVGPFVAIARTERGRPRNVYVPLRFDPCRGTRRSRPTFAPCTSGEYLPEHAAKIGDELNARGIAWWTKDPGAISRIWQLGIEMFVDRDRLEEAVQVAADDRRGTATLGALMPRTVDDLLRGGTRDSWTASRPSRRRRNSSDGALLIDVRTEAQRATHGAIPGAVAIGLNVLEWRLDPASEWRIPQAIDHDVRAIVFCQEGYSSSLAAARLQSLGLHRATDVIGGFEAWRDAGLPVDPIEP